jgi:hypothetical protein
MLFIAGRKTDCKLRAEIQGMSQNETNLVLLRIMRDTATGNLRDGSAHVELADNTG